jgi:16S rRNA (uracil1498-N3)-methyltransferase
MKQILLPNKYNGEAIIAITGPDFHHLARVLRCQTGEKINVTDRDGVSFKAIIREITDESVILSIEQKNIEESDKTSIKLVQSIPKGKKIDLIIRQAVEAGISAIFPVISRNTIVRFENEKDIEHKRQRWNSIAKEAFMQSGTCYVPMVGKPVNLPEMEFEENSLKLFFHQEKSESVPLHTCLYNDYGIVYIFIGPEGGYTEEEVRFLKGKGCIPVYLGNSVLRTETAALFAIAAVKIILLEKSTWRKE